MTIPQLDPKVLPPERPDKAPYAQRRKGPSERELTDIRGPFAIDCDRILYSRAYSRYIDKTQVFYLLKNDHITHRVLHVQLVSRIARTIGKKLDLDLDFLEAASLGHDLGHPPFGHDGEHFLSDLCEEAGIGKFVHPVMSLRFLESLEKGGKGLNLTLGVLDAILCHDGESDFVNLAPSGSPQTPASFEELDRRVAIRAKDPNQMINPMTAEGCVVRLSDSISYVGRDLEDAILLGVLQKEDIPQDISMVLGTTTGSIVYSLVTDLIETSLSQSPKVSFSPVIGSALTALKHFNEERIYHNPKVKKDKDKIKRLFSMFFSIFTEEFSHTPKSERLNKYLSSFDDSYREKTNAAEKARDFIAGMTDEYFYRMAEEYILPRYNNDFIDLE
jgi:dGTPase